MTTEIRALLSLNTPCVVSELELPASMGLQWPPHTRLCTGRASRATLATTSSRNISNNPRTSTVLSRVIILCRRKDRHPTNQHRTTRRNRDADSRGTIPAPLPPQSGSCLMWGGRRRGRGTQFWGRYVRSACFSLVLVFWKVRGERFVRMRVVRVNGRTSNKQLCNWTSLFCLCKR